MEHSFNKWVFIIHNPNHDQIKWNKPNFKLKRLGSNGFYAAYDPKMKALQVICGRYVYEWRNVIPQETYKTLENKAKISDQAVRDYFFSEILRVFGGYTRSRNTKGL